MKARLKKVHLIVGLIALVIFPLTGVYMRISSVHPAAQQQNP
jgi:hypothetical protein